MTGQNIQQVDVAIIGGNMVGASLALALANSKLKVILIEQHSIPTCLKNTLDLRVSAVIPAAVQFLKSLQVWDYIPEHRKHPFQRMSIWEKQLGNAFQFDATPSEPLGYIIENGVMQWAIWQKLQLSAVQCIQGSWQHVEQAKDHVKITLNNGQTIQSRLLVGADGPHSKVRQAAGIRSTIHHYNQMCIVGAVRPQKHHQNTCWQRYNQGLACAFLPLNDTHCSLAWYVNPERYPSILQASTQDQAKQLTTDSGGMLGNIEIDQTLSGFPIKRLTIDRWFKHRIILAGDSAHVIHPMAGQGVNLGYIDAATLAEELLTSGAYFDHEITLKRYQRRRSETAVIQYSMDVFNTFFTSAPNCVAQARSKSLSMANQLSPLKKLFANYATGHTRDLPLSMIYPSLSTKRITNHETI